MSFGSQLIKVIWEKIRTIGIEVKAFRNCYNLSIFPDTRVAIQHAAAGRFVHHGLSASSMV